jgi:hypothetical protein
MREAPHTTSMYGLERTLCRAIPLIVNSIGYITKIVPNNVHPEGGDEEAVVDGGGKKDADGVRAAVVEPGEEQCLCPCHQGSRLRAL